MCARTKNLSFFITDLFHTYTAHIRAVMGVKTNYVSAWKPCYVTGVAANIAAAAHPMHPESRWHGIISVKKKYISSNTDFHACLNIHFCTVAFIRCSGWVTASLWCMLFFLCNMLRTSRVELFLGGVCLAGWRALRFGEEDDERLPEASWISRKHEGWRKWREVLMTILNFESLQRGEKEEEGVCVH